MRWTWIVTVTVGLALSGLGLLWFLQGSNLVHLDPIACVGDCAPVVGHHPQWQIVGAIACLIGLFATVLATTRLRR